MERKAADRRVGDESDLVFCSQGFDGYVVLFAVLVFAIAFYPESSSPREADMAIFVVKGIPLAIAGICYSLYRLYTGSKPVISLSRTGLIDHRKLTKPIAWDRIKSVELIPRGFFQKAQVKVDLVNSEATGFRDSLLLDKPNFSTSADEVYRAVAAHFHRYRNKV